MPKVKKSSTILQRNDILGNIKTAMQYLANK